MKTVKFRAWDKTQNKMINVPKLCFGEDGRALTITIGIKTSEGYDKDLVVGETADLMQYTGIKDSLGQEIYENDIVRYEANDGEADDIIIAVVKFDDDENETSTISGFKLEYCDRDSRGEDELEDGIFQKLGNIYENSDLISE